MTPLSPYQRTVKAPTGRCTPKLLLVALCILSLGVSSRALAQHKTQVANIDAYVVEINQFIKQNRKAARIFADVSGTEEKPNQWREFRNEEEMERARTGDNLNTIAFVWTRAGKVTGTSFTFTSPSGDWAHLLTYYFREDGSLAKISAQLNTFYGDLSIIRELYFDKRGALLKNTRRYVDLKTKKAKKPGEFFDHSVPMYLNVQALPFHKLL
ncbi:MAG TPA: hypothetical protein VF074_17055 [Pyrinomonadaceae bacterium]